MILLLLTFPTEALALICAYYSPLFVAPPERDYKEPNRAELFKRMMEEEREIQIYDIAGY